MTNKEQENKHNPSLDFKLYLLISKLINEHTDKAYIISNIYRCINYEHNLIYNNNKMQFSKIELDPEYPSY